MPPLRQWFHVSFPRLLSDWLLRFYRRPLSFLLGLVFIPLLIVVVAAYQVNARLLREQSLHNLGITARLAAEIVDRTLQETWRLEQLLAQEGLADAIKTRRPEAMQRQLEALVQLMPTAVSAHMLDVSGRVLAAYPPALERASAAEEGWFREAREPAWHPSVSAVYLQDEADGAPRPKVVSVTCPLLGHDDVLGLLQVEYRVDDVKSWLQTVRVEPEGFLYVVDQQDQLVVYPYQVLPGTPKRVSSWPPVAQPVDRAGSTLVFKDRHQRAWLAAVQPVGRTRWRVIATQPADAAMRTVSHVFVWLGLMCVLLFGLIVLISLRWVRLHEFSLDLLRQNSKLLRQLQQHRISRRKDDGEGKR